MSFLEVSSVLLRPSQQNLLALLASLGLHTALLLSATLRASSPPPRLDVLPNSVAMPGNAIEVEAPSPELVSAPGAVAGAPAPAPAPVDVHSLPTETSAPEAESLAPTVPRVAPKPVAAPKPRPKPKPAKLPLADGNAAASSPGQDAPATGAPAAGTFGQEGLAPGVRRLGYAFARAIPAATPADPSWRELPAGHVGTIRIELSVDENNRLGALQRWQARPGEPPPPTALVRMVERTLVLLRAGQFALSGSNQPGAERLVIDVTLRDERGEEDATAEVVQKSFEGAIPGRPGKAYFRYGTGRAFEAKVTIASSGR